MMMKWIIGTSLALSATALALAARAAHRATRGRVQIRNGVITGPGGFSYHMTEDDKLWLARAVWGESGERGGVPGAAVAWAMAQYMALVIGRGGRRPAFASMTTMLQSYCQPINPRWASMSASGCRDRPAHCTERHLARRRQITNASWNEIPARVRQLVQDFVAGQVANPVPGAVDWAAQDWSSRAAGPLTNVQGNYFGVGSSRRMV